MTYYGIANTLQWNRNICYIFIVQKKGASVARGRTTRQSHQHHQIWPPIGCVEPITAQLALLHWSQWQVLIHFPPQTFAPSAKNRHINNCCWRRRWPLQEASTTRIHRMIDEDQDISRRAGCNLWLKRWFWRWRKNKTKQQLMAKRMRADELGNWQKLENWGTSWPVVYREEWQHISSIYVKPTPNPP